MSLDPPLVMIALDRNRFITPIVHATRRYAVNVLGEDQQGLSDCFAGAPVTPDRGDFCGAAWSPGTLGLPLLDGAIATLECEVVETFSVGDHDLFIGRVDAVANPEQHPDAAARTTAARYLRIDRAHTPSSRASPRRPGRLMPTIAANGLEIGYDVHGAGPPLVMLHGAGSAGREDWAAQVPAFARGFHLYLPDARGHATTRYDVRDGFSYAMLVDDLAGVRGCPRPRDVPPRRVLDGRADGADLRDASPGARPDAARGRDQHRARAARQHRAAPDGPRPAASRRGR